MAYFTDFVFDAKVRRAMRGTEKRLKKLLRFTIIIGPSVPVMKQYNISNLSNYLEEIFNFHHTYRIIVHVLSGSD